MSVCPASRTHKERWGNKFSESLVAANGSEIPTYGKTSLKLDLGFRKCKWDFVLAAVQKTIIGADFLSYFGLLVDIRGKRLIDLDSLNGVKLCLSKLPSLRLHTLQPRGVSSILTEEFPELLTPTFNTSQAKHGVQHHIVTTGQPTFAKARRLGPDKLEIAMKDFKFLEDAGIARRSNSSWASPLHMVPKPDGSWRPCGDYRALNSKTKPDRYPIPHIQDFAANLRGMKVFSKIDLYKGYYNIPVAPEDVPKTAVITPFGLFEFLRLPFGLCNAAQTFQRLMHSVLRNIDGIFVYIDDILVASKDEESHQNKLRELFSCLRDNGLAVNADKCVFGVPSLTFLGHQVDSEGVRPLPKRVAAVRDFPAPKDKSSLQEFLGLINYYHRFIPHAAHVLQPLNAALRKSAGPFSWTPQLDVAFIQAKEALANAALLVHPQPDADTSITVDASDRAIGASLEQFVDGAWKPIAFFSASLKPAETRYSTFDRELLAVYRSIRHFRHFIEGRHFHVYTDHKPLTFALSSQTDYTPRQIRHLSFISEFTTDLRYLPGKSNSAADALSRNAPVVAAVAPLPDIDFQLLAKAQAEDVETDAYRTAVTGLQLEECPLEGGGTLLCDVSTGRPRPLVPAAWRKRVFDAVHGMSHPGVRATRRMVAERFVWHTVNKDAAAWARSCVHCQRAKIQLHTATPLQQFDPPGRRFEHVHVDIVGPLPQSAGYRYLFTVVDRFTRWVDAVPMVDATTVSCARVFLLNWVARYGVPLNMTSDRGAQFTSGLWSALANLMGTKLHRTTAYHPQANGMVERFHRQLKAALKAKLTSASWTDELPIVLLGIRTTPKEDLHCAPAELVYGTTLRIPGEFHATDKLSSSETQHELLTRLRSTMRKLRATPPLSHGKRAVKMPAGLATAEFVFVRHDAVRPPLQPPYDGPFRIVERHDKYFIVEMNGRQDSVSLDRLKPAFLDT